MEESLRQLHDGSEKIAKGAAERKRRWAYYEGDHVDLPYAPEGASADYLELREMSPLPLVRLAVRTPLQRLRVKGLQTKSKTASKAHRLAWQANKLDSNQKVPYTHAMVYGEGYMAAWPNMADRSRPIVRVESPDLVWLERDPTDPLRTKWSVKVWSEQYIEAEAVKTKDVGVVYHDTEFWRYERGFSGGDGILIGGGGGWQLVAGGHQGNPLGRNPMIPFMADLDSKGRGASMVKPLIPMQRAIDTMRFDLLLAAQFAAYRQRIATGYDPVVRDADGKPVWMRDDQGQIIMDPINGLPMPLLSNPGRVGVDRLLAFPGADTKIFDLQESNLENYVTGLQFLVATFASTAQVPPQYLVGKFDNVSGDLMTATEVTLNSLLGDLKVSFGESIEDLHQLMGLAVGDPDMVDDEAEVIWDETSPVSLQQIADFASKMVPLGYPMREVVQMLPGVSQAQAEGMDLEPPKAATAPPVAPAPGDPAAASSAGDPPTPPGSTDE